MKTSKPKISVIMPAYNSQAHIGAAIDSILNQTFKDFELIIVNDASTDKTKKIVESYKKKDVRVRLINNKDNIQIGSSLNKGIAEANALIIARMDSDDVSLPERFEKQYKLLKKQPKVAVVGCNMITMDENGKEFGRREYATDSDVLKKKLFRYSPFAHPSTMFRKSVFHRMGGYNPVLSPTEDLDLWMRVGMKYDFSNVPEYLFKYRVYQQSTSNRRLRYLEIKVILIRLNALIFYGYKPSLLDILYNIGQFITIFLMPINFRYKLFNILRNRNLI